MKKKVYVLERQIHDGTERTVITGVFSSKKKAKKDALKHLGVDRPAEWEWVKLPSGRLLSPNFKNEAGRLNAFHIIGVTVGFDFSDGRRSNNL